MNVFIMSAKTVAMIIILLYNVRICQSRHYDNYTLYSVVPHDEDQLMFLQNLEKQKYIDVIFWKKPYKLHADVQLIVSRGDKKVFLERAEHFDLVADEMLPNVEKAFEDQLVRKYLRSNPDKYTWNYYHSLEDIYQWLKDMSSQHPNMKLTSIGKSVENRDIYAVSFNNSGKKPKLTAIVEAGIHGNEWIGVEFVTYLLNVLVTRKDPRNWLTHQLARKYDWYLVPVANPDGYVYSQTKDRLWRKNRRPFNGPVGVDLNRNFDYSFGTHDASNDPNDDNYCGSYPFSEPETKALADFITVNNRKLEFYFAFHGYGQKLIIPYGDRVKHIENYNEMENIGTQAVMRMRKIFGMRYRVGTTFDTLGMRISGNSASWVKKNHSVRGIPVEENHLQYYKNLTYISDVNFWREPGLLNMPVEFVVGPEAKEHFLKEADRVGLYLTTIIEDVQNAFDQQTVKTYIRRQMNSFNWNNYFRLEDIYQWLTDLSTANPVEMTVQSIGRTFEKRDIMAVRIILKGSKRRSKVIIEGGIHAREWISPAFVTYLIHQIIHSQTSNNEQLKDIALTYEWFFVPVLNPDGYAYTHSNDRLWRKNRNVHGVDLNRNFDIAFGTIGVSKQAPSSTYCGPSPFSERESKAMRSFVTSQSNGLEYYLAFHSYGQYIIIPYAFTKKHEENFDEVKKMCMTAGEKMAAKYRTKYSVGTAYDTIGYMTSGVSGCWVKKTFNVPYVVTFELRDEGFFGFALPPNMILPTCQETMDGIISLLTPSQASFKKLRNSRNFAEPQFIFDKIVTVFNVLLFIIVRFD